MAVPTVPTVTSILTEAFRRCGFPTPTTQQLTRAEDEWLEEAKRELTSEKRWRNLEETMVMIPQAYVQAYPVPSPLYRILRIRFYDGATKGQASAGGALSLTVAAGTGNPQWVGRKVFLTGGTGAAQVNRILAVSGDVVTVAVAWVTVPDATSTYLIAEVERDLRGPEQGLSRLGVSQGQPVAWEESEQIVRLWPVPDVSTYAVELDGIVDLSLIDETNARLTLLLREWRSFLVYAVAARIAEDNEDKDNTLLFESRAERAKLRLMREDSRRVLGLRAARFRSPGGLPARR